MRGHGSRNYSRMLAEIIQAAVFAFVFSDVLIQPGQIFGFYGDWLDRKQAGGAWWAKPAGLCGRCFSGQVGAWAYLFLCPQYDFRQHIIFAASVIFSYLLFRTWIKTD